jgi:DNA (cytosine-5)-methyltransferase 1
MSDVVGTLSDGAHNGGGLNGQDAYTGRILPVAFDARQNDVLLYGDKTGPLDTDGHSVGVCVTGNRTHALTTRSAAEEDGTGRGTPIVPAGRMAVRRLTPRECERLQGFPDDYTLIPWKKKPADECPDGPRYKALGNSMAVPVMRWIGERIAKVEKV